MLAMKFSSIVMIFGSMKSTPETMRGQTQCVRLVRSPSPPAFTTCNYRHHWPAGFTNASISNRIQHRLELGDICDDRIASKTQIVDRTLSRLCIAMAAATAGCFLALAGPSQVSAAPTPIRSLVLTRESTVPDEDPIYAARGIYGGGRFFGGPRIWR